MKSLEGTREAGRVDKENAIYFYGQVRHH